MEKADETEETIEVEEVGEEEEAVKEESETAEEADKLAEEEIVEEVEEEVKPEIVDERVYTIPLSRAWIAPRRKRAPKAVRLLRNFIERHMKVGAGSEVAGENERLVISNEVNEKIWSRGIEKPPRRIKIRAVRDIEGTVTVYLAR